MLNEKFRGMSGVVGSVVVATLSVVACSDSFSGGEDCKSTRTCPEVAGSGGSGDSAEGGGGALSGSADAAAGAEDATTAGAAGAAGAASGCETDQECSNGVAEDGVELCEKGVCLPGNPPPTVVSVIPDDDASGVEPDTEVVIEFSEPIDPATVTNKTVQLLDGSTPVPGKLSYVDGKVTFTPDAPLTLLAPYTVSVTSGVTDEDGAALLEEFSSTFAVRDGAWTTIDVVKDRVNRLSDTLPISAAGNVLVAWSGKGDSYCPASARWYARGVPISPTKSFPVASQFDCNGVTASGNAAGDAAVFWTEPDSSNGAFIAQFRAGAWGGSIRVSKNYFANNETLAVAPSGVVTFFEPSNETKAWVSSTNGDWPADGDVLGSYWEQSRTSFDFDAKGNGLALWRGNDPDTHIERIVASRFSSGTGKWGAAVELPGSVGSDWTGTHQRGVPVVAMDDAGNAMALWIRASLLSTQLMASRFVQSSGWAEPELVSGALVVQDLEDPPALVFDGKQFVAAWTAKESGKVSAYTARYDLKTGWNPYDKQQQTAGDGTSAARMPRLTSDRRGNLLLLFAEGAAPTFSLVYQRYAAGAWGPILTLPGGTITSQVFEDVPGGQMSMNASGLAAFAWGDMDASNFIATVRLASFF